MNKSRYICHASILLPEGRVVEISKDFTILVTENALPPGNLVTVSILIVPSYSILISVFFLQMIKV